MRESTPRATARGDAIGVVTRYVALLRNPAPLLGRCPACDELMDESGCRIGEHYVSRDVEQTKGIAQVVEVFCSGVLTGLVHECPCCAVHHPGAPCNRA